MAEIADEADVHHYIYISVLPLLKNHEQISKGILPLSKWAQHRTAVVQRRTDGVFQFWARLLRMRETIETHDSGEIHLLEVMENQISGLSPMLSTGSPRVKTGYAGDRRGYALCRRSLIGMEQEELLSISVDQLAEFSKSILSLSVDERKEIPYNLSGG